MSSILSLQKKKDDSQLTKVTGCKHLNNYWGVIIGRIRPGNSYSTRAFTVLSLLTHILRQLETMNKDVGDHQGMLNPNEELSFA